MYTGIPLYYRIANHLRNRIMSGAYPPGEKIPTENKLCSEFNTSRITIRQSLKILESQGMLIRKQGVGTLVNQNVKLKPISFNGYVEDIIFQLLPARVIQFQKKEIAANSEIKQLLKLTDNENTIIQLERVRAIGNQINSYALNFLPLKIGRDIEENSLEKHSLIELIDQGKDSVYEATQTIKAIAANEVVAGKLGIHVADPVLFSEYTMFNMQRDPINVARVYYHADRYRYTVEMGRLTTET
ncbi:GntR family transcriptional regulator [Virgibacillus sp. DJP39]|uniref:GntR family transcriptional regulator n=1 Tax=Virgibacillus sp. DJP39 TaxID=3409790 RepID=UPI003BB73AD8